MGLIGKAKNGRQPLRIKGLIPTRALQAPARQCPSISPKWEDPQGVPLSAILFGARRARVAPLICESRNWQHGVFLGATMASETTAAATGQVGVIRRDPDGDASLYWLQRG